MQVSPKVPLPVYIMCRADNMRRLGWQACHSRIIFQKCYPAKFVKGENHSGERADEDERGSQARGLVEEGSNRNFEESRYAGLVESES